MRRVCNTVVVSYCSCGAYQYVAKAGLADVAAPVVARKALYQHGRIVVLAVHEYQVVWNEHVVEDYHRLLPGVHGVAGIDGTAFGLHAPGVARLPAVNVFNARRVDRDCTDDGIVLVLRLESHGWHDHYPVRIDAASLVCFCAGDVYALRVALDHVHEHVGIWLLRRREASVALDVCHCAADDHVFALHHPDELDKALVVLGIILLVNFKSC